MFDAFDHLLAVSGVLLAGKKGAKHTKPRATNSGKKSKKFTPIQQDILVGTMLGDASAERNKPTHNTRIGFNQTFPMHAAYLTHLFLSLYDFVGKAPTVIFRKPDLRTGLIYTQMVFKTLAFPCLNMYYDLFYLNGVKVVPVNISELLTARALAYWIMDDGGISSYGQTILHTNSFTLQEVQLLQAALMSNFQLRTRLIEKREGQWLICIPVKQVVPLRTIVLPYMHVSMMHKI